MDTNEVTIKNFRSIKEGDVPLKDSKELEEDFEELPTILKEGEDFLNELPDRLYLDSDPEFHLNVHIVFSYLLLYQIDSHILMVVRRIVTIYLTFMITGLGFFIYLRYYPLLLDEPILHFEQSIINYVTER